MTLNALLGVRLFDVFCDAGAYGFSMASHYNARLLPPEVLISNGNMTTIRTRQATEDLIRGME